MAALKSFKECLKALPADSLALIKGLQVHLHHLGSSSAEASYDGTTHASPTTVPPLNPSSPILLDHLENEVLVFWLLMALRAELL